MWVVIDIERVSMGIDLYVHKAAKAPHRLYVIRGVLQTNLRIGATVLTPREPELL